MFRSATFKLTMWYLAIVVTISLAFSVVLYRVATSELDRGLQNETQRIYRQFPVFEDNPVLRPGVDYDSGAHRIFLRLVLFNIIVLIGAGLSSYWLARKTLEPIEEAHEQQKRFTADVSHELRTPLTALKMESEVALMSKKASANDLRKTVASNLEEAVKLEGLVNSLLRLARLETGELRQEFSLISTDDIANTALKQIDHLAHDKKVKLESQLKDFQVYGNLNGLVQLLVIILDNAVKYSPTGSKVLLSTQGEGDEVLFIVEDHGQGIDPVALEHVFDRFYRADASRVKDVEGQANGYGLGLSIAKMIADLHGGTITLSSRAAHGTKATITIPTAEAAESATARHPIG